MSGRGRFGRPEERGGGGGGRGNPPSRHLWVGNLAHDLDESTLARLFLQFGELESVAFQPGRSYAFVNFIADGDAFAAIEELQGYMVGGNSLKIEFTKAEKSTPRRDDNYIHRRDEDQPGVRGSSFPHRDPNSRVRYSSPESGYPERAKMNDNNAEPSEVLWIGFPAQLKVDEFILRRTFSPFGEINKISAFPGRPYAFVRFTSVSAAREAKETLQGKLFGNPRVHLCFAKSESGASYKDRNSVHAQPSPLYRPYGHTSENFHQDWDFRDSTGDFSIRSPRITPNLEPVEPHLMDFGRKRSAWPGENSGFGQRFPEPSERGILRNVHNSPLKHRGLHFDEFPPREFPWEHPFDDDPYDLPEDSLLYRGAKKLKPSLLNELPNYPYSDSGQIKHVPSRAYPGIQHDEYDQKIAYDPLSHRQIHDGPMESAKAYEKRNHHISVPSDGFSTASVSFPAVPEWNRLTPESGQSSASKEWKWEGTIAKGGTPVCRVCCFPVGQLMDIVLPEILDCTARTSLDMLAKHYYQAAAAWVVFFVPATDPDIAFYNEFMNYLGEKQRAAVAKLDDKSTLFLVPPSDFSEKVLKVPGKLSISGVVLRSDQPGSTYASFHQPPPVMNEPQYKPTLPMPDFERPGTGKTLVPGSFSTAAYSRPGVRDDRPVDPNWSAHNMQSSSSNARGIASHEGYNPVPVTGIRNQPLQQKPPDLSALQPEELLQLASSLLEQQRNSGAPISSGAQQRYVPSNQHAPEPSSSQQYSRMQPQIAQVPALPQCERQPGGSLQNEPHQTAEQEDGDTEKRLQATLHLAAALLQQIQQGKGS